MVYALGLGDYLVGRSHECDYPPLVKRLPVCTQPNFDVNGTSLEIDQSVKAHLEHGVSIYKIDAKLISNLNPDVILTQSHCDVCAVSQTELEKALGEQMAGRIKIVSLRPNALDDFFSGMLDVGAVLGVKERAEEKCGLYRRKMNRIAERTRDLPRPTIAAVEWIDPLMSAGNWMPELIEMAGGKNLFGEAGKHSPGMSYQQLKSADPNFILVLPCGFDIDRARSEMDPLTQQPGWYDLSAVRNNRVLLLDGNQYFNRPGPRLVESLEILAEIFHPDLFDFGHKLTGWQYWGFDRVS